MLTDYVLILLAKPSLRLAVQFFLRPKTFEVFGFSLSKSKTMTNNSSKQGTGGEEQERTISPAFFLQHQETLNLLDALQMDNVLEDDHSRGREASVPNAFLVDSSTSSSSIMPLLAKDEGRKNDSCFQQEEGRERSSSRNAQVMEILESVLELLDGDDDEAVYNYSPAGQEAGEMRTRKPSRRMTTRILAAPQQNPERGDDRSQ